MRTPGISDAKEYLTGYKGRKLRLMEVCGTHTASIRQNGIPSFLSDSIQLVTGPGCPVCVTVSGYIDRLIKLSENPKNVVAVFGDMMRVPGSGVSLMQKKAEGADIRYVYSPMDILEAASQDREHDYIFAATGFETTVPVYAALLSRAEKEGMKNIKLLTSVKLMPQAIRKVSDGIDGFLAPGHVSVIAGTEDYKTLAEELKIPFVISGFRGEELIASIYALVKMAEKGRAGCLNLYPRAVREDGNRIAREAVEQYFEKGDVPWRGMGIIPDSGLFLKEQYQRYDAGSRDIYEDLVPSGCRCPEVITGKISPGECPLFGGKCTPQNPIGACMVSVEGACHNESRGKKV